jgi:urease subunit gamma/beta
VLDGVDRLLPRLEVEALFEDGSRLVVLEHPIGRSGPPERRDVEIPWGSGTPLEIVNEGDVPVALTSHFHVFEANRALRFDRAAAWGMRLDVPAGVKVFFDPGVPVTVRLRPFGGNRVIRGHGGLVDGPLDAPGAREAALQLARERGYRGA